MNTQNMYLQNELHKYFLKPRRLCEFPVSSRFQGARGPAESQLFAELGNSRPAWASVRCSAGRCPRPIHRACAHQAIGRKREPTQDDEREQAAGQAHKQHGCRRPPQKALGETRAQMKKLVHQECLCGCGAETVIADLHFWQVGVT